MSLCDGRLLVYAETHVDVFDCASGEWVQSINVRRTRPLDAKTGLLNLSMLQEMPHLTYLSNILKGGSSFVMCSCALTTYLGGTRSDARFCHKFLCEFH